MPTGVDTRLAACRPEELPAVAALIERTFADELDLAVADRLTPDLEAIAARNDPEGEMALVAETERELAGALVVRCEETPGPRAVLLSWLVVAPRWRQRGIGRALLAFALEDYRARRIPVVRARCLAVSPAAPRLFWEFGFRAAALTSLRLGGRPCEVIVFEKRLTQPPASA